MMIKPNALQFGSTIGVVAPSSPVSKKIADESKKALEELKFKVKMGSSCYERYGYLAGNDNIRAGDINNMFSDEEVDGIICLRGGYGSIKILNLIDYEMIKSNPKVFIGYSDITALHLAIHKKCNMVTIHGPMVSSDMLNGFDNFSKESLFNTIMKNEPVGSIKNPDGEKIRCLVPGKARGKLIGGNLSLIAAVMGTPYALNMKNKIVFIEETEEEPYRIDRMLAQLVLSGALSGAAGIVLGDFRNCEAKDVSESLSLMEVFNDILKPLHIPVIYNVKAGHCTSKISLPFGTTAYIDADNCKLIIEESAVK